MYEFPELCRATIHDSIFTFLSTLSELGLKVLHLLEKKNMLKQENKLKY